MPKSSKEDSKTRGQTANSSSRMPTPDPKSRTQTPDPKSRSVTPDPRSKNEFSGTKIPEVDEIKDNILSEMNSRYGKGSGRESSENNRKDSKDLEDPALYFTTEPSGESGKMNTGVQVIPETTDAVTDTNDDDSDMEDDWCAGGSRHSRGYIRSAGGPESRYRPHEPAGNKRCDSARSLDRYRCGYLQPSMSFDTRYHGLNTQTERYRDIVRPFRHCTFTDSSDYCCRRM